MFPPKTRVLIVDDMKTIRNLVRQVLSTLRLTNVVEHSDGEAAWKDIEASADLKQAFGLVVSDWAMPKLSGIELLKRVRMNEAVMGTPFLMITAENEAAQVKEAIVAGVSNYITKPFTPDTVKAKIEAVWKKHHG
jgi:two-component system chemotaxis response regulator CheY